jgi:hypothetical protein
LALSGFASASPLSLRRKRYDVAANFVASGTLAEFFMPR